MAAEIRAWQGSLMELIRTEGQGKRTQARWLSFGINGLGAALMIVVFSMTAGLTGLEIGVAGGTAVVGQRLLEAVFGEDAVRRLARTAREDLHARCQRLLAGGAAALPGPAGRTPAGSPDVLAGHAAALAPAGGRRMSRHGAAREASQLDRRLEALNEARELAAGVLPEDALEGVLQVLDRASSRRSLSGGPHRGGLLRGHRQRKVLPLQRGQRRGNRDGGRPAAHHLRTAGRHLGSRRQRAAAGLAGGPEPPPRRARCRVSPTRARA